MYERIVVATDAARPATAVTIASALAAETGALELVTVVPPDVPLGVGRVELERLAVRHGWMPASCTVLAGRDVATTLLGHVARRRDALLVIGSRGHHPLTAVDGTGPVTRQLLADATDPIVVVGPHVGDRFHPRVGKLVVAVDGHVPTDAALDAVGGWVDTFSARRTWVVEVVGHAERFDDRDVMPWVRALGARGIPASHRVLNGTDAADAVDRFSVGVPNAVIVVTSRRYSDGHRHLHSTTQQLIRSGHHPVLVVPVPSQPRSQIDGPDASGPLALPA